MASLADYPRVLKYAELIGDKLDERGNDIPAWLPLGWIWKESAGRISDADRSVPSLGGELGLFQLDQGERKATHFTDEQKLLSDPDYSVNAGIALIDHYTDAVDAVGVESDNNDAERGPLYYWLVKFAHGAGKAAMQSIVRAFKAANLGRSPASIDEFRTFAAANPYRSSSYTQHHMDNTDSVRRNGLALEAAAGLGWTEAGSITPWVAAGLVAALVVVWWAVTR